MSVIHSFKPRQPSFDVRLYFRNLAAMTDTPQIKPYRYALLREPLDPAIKPVVFTDLHRLARAIHADRGEDEIRLLDQDLDINGETYCGVTVTTTSETTTPRLLGWAYLDGQKWEALQAGLLAVQPVRRPRAA